MSKLVRRNPETPEGKYLVTRRDGSSPEWPYFVLGAKDPAVPFALMAYASECERLGMDSWYVAEVRQLSREFQEYCESHGVGDQDGQS